MDRSVEMHVPHGHAKKEEDAPMEIFGPDMRHAKKRRRRRRRCSYGDICTGCSCKVICTPTVQVYNDIPALFREVENLGRLAKYFKFKLIMAAAMIAAYCIVRQDLTEHASILYLTVCHILVFVNFIADIILTLISPLFGRIKIRYLKNIIYVTNIVAMLTSTNLMILLNTSFAPFTILLLPVIAIVVVVFCKEFKTAQAHEVTDDGKFQSELKKFFNLSVSLTNAAFGGMIAIGYFKKFSKDVDQVPVQFFDVFIFLTVNFGLLAMLLTAVPPSLHHSKVKESLVSFIRVLSYTLFGLIALTGLAFVGEYMGRFILLAFFPIIFGVAVWFSNSLVPRVMKPGTPGPSCSSSGAAH